MKFSYSYSYSYSWGNWADALFCLWVACRKPAGGQNRSPSVLYVLEHKTKNILIHAPHTCSVAFWHINDMASGQNGHKPKRPKPKQPQTETATDRNGHKPKWPQTKRPQTKMDTN